MQEDKSTVYVTLHVDRHPQLRIENACPFAIFVGQANEDSDGVLPDAPHFDWRCRVGSGAACHYSTPGVGSRLPDLPAGGAPEAASLLVSTSPAAEESLGDRLPDSTDRSPLHWSKSIDLMNYPAEQFVRLPYYGDVKLTMRTKCYTTYLTFSPVSQVCDPAHDFAVDPIR